MEHTTESANKTAALHANAEQAVTSAELDAKHLLHELQVHQVELEMQNEELCRTVAELRQSEESLRIADQQLQQAQKLESLGVLAGGIAHDFNNILAIIIGNCSLAKLHYESAGNFIPAIEKAAERAATLCRQMLAYAGQSSLNQTQVVLWLLVDDVVKMLSSTVRQNVVISTTLSAQIPSIRGDAGQLSQVVMNLIMNACEAIGEEQGEVLVSLTEVTMVAEQGDKDHLGREIAPGHYLCLDVTDTGCGMDDEVRRKLFEPFFTTKFTGRGLGMSAVLGILKAHHGALQFVSLPGQGTTFSVFFPVADAHHKQCGAEPQGNAHQWRGSGTILLVEDEPEVQMVATDMLVLLGFNVIKAANGQEALHIYQQNRDAISLVMADVGMPVMDGYTLFRELKKLKADLPIIISSGFGSTEIIAKLDNAELAGLVGKPYNFTQLRDVLKMVADTRPL